MRMQQSRLTRPLHAATVPCYLGHGGLSVCVCWCVAEHLSSRSFAKHFCLVCHAITVQHLQINQRKVRVRLILGQERYAEHVGQSRCSGGAPSRSTFWCSVLLGHTHDADVRDHYICTVQYICLYAL